MFHRRNTPPPFTKLFLPPSPRVLLSALPAARPEGGDTHVHPAQHRCGCCRLFTISCLGDARPVKGAAFQTQKPVTVLQSRGILPVFRTNSALLITWEEDMGNKVLLLERDLVAFFWRSWEIAPGRRTISYELDRALAEQEPRG